METKPKGGANARPDPQPTENGLPGQVVFVLQGGGALGAYQAGVYQALHEAGIEPDWIIGTSIGAINGAIIAGNQEKDRLDQLRQFWDRVAYRGLMEVTRFFPGVENTMLNLATLTQGIPNFFESNPGAWQGLHAHLGVERAAFYSTAPLRATLSSLVDFDYLNEKHMRLTVGTDNVLSGRMCYFTNRDIAPGLEHVMASAAIPPAFPAVRINGEAYWDGGVYSNNPLEAVLDDYPRRSSVIFAVQMWPSEGPEPETLWQVMSRQRDIQYSSRAESHLARQRQIHRLRHVIRELEKYIPESERESPTVKDLLSYPDTPYVFVSGRKAPLTTDTVRKIVTRAGREAGIEFQVHPHMLRHATGYKLANDGQDTRAIQQYLGHQNIQNTTRYTELAPDRFKDFWSD